MIVYVDDIILIRYDSEGILELNEGFTKEFEIKDLANLKYFLSME